MNIGNIINGWGNLLLSKTIGISSHIDAQAEIRKTICESCPANIRNYCDSHTKMTHVIKQIDVFGCNCPIKAKTMAQHDECPAGKWLAMQDEKTWKHTLQVSKYKRLIMLSRWNNEEVVLYNNTDAGMFFTDAGIAYPYLEVGKMAANRLLKCVNLLDVMMITDINEHTNSFKISPGVQSLNASLIDSKRADIIVWIPKSALPNISMDSFMMKCEMLCSGLSTIFNNPVRYVYSISNDISTLRTVLETQMYYLDDSSIMQTIKDKLQL